MVSLEKLVASAGPLPGRAAVRVDVPGGGEPTITAVVHSTDAVVPGALFCCVRGSRVDGHDLAPAAIEAGAAALVVDRRLSVAELGGTAVPQVLVADVRAAMGPLAAAFWGHPSRHLSVVGITGTAGKTTVTGLVGSLLNALDRPCDVIGTLSGARTTPEGPELQAGLAAAVGAGRSAVAVEVSSHGLQLHRVDGTWFTVAAFTNLSRDHLDFHATMEEYFAAKSLLFTPGFCDRAVICTDDEWGRRLADDAAGRGLRVVRCSVDDAEDLHLEPDGARFSWRGHPATIGLPGRFNVANAVVAATVVAELGLPSSAIAEGLRSVVAVPGRFERVAAGQPFTVLVDYAHKPEALEQALRAARDLAAGRVLVVFGCGGDRDPGKRPLMGAVAGRLADHVVVTSDNPRSEDPAAIIAAVRAGVPAGTSLEVEPDRRRAIESALTTAGPGDVVLIAGKGHEAYQVIGDHVAPFDDRAVARDALSTAGWGDGDATT